MDFAEQTAGIKKVSNVGGFDVHILCVSRHKPDDMFIPQMDGLFQTTDKISREAKSGAFVSTECTIPKGTSKKIFEILNHRSQKIH